MTDHARESLRVLHVVKGLGPGGAERLLLSLCSARSASTQFDVAYVLPHKSHLVAALEAAGATVHCIGGRHGLADPRWIVRLRRLIRLVRPDVVHVHSPAVAPVVRLGLRFDRDRPAIVSFEQNVWGSYNGLTRVANGITIRLSDLHLAVSDEVRLSMWRSLRATTQVLGNAIDLVSLTALRPSREAARAALGLQPEDVLVVSVANFREKKDHPTLFEAIRQCEAEPRLRFMIIGQGPLEAQLRSRVRALGIEDRVNFVGYHPEPPELLVAADLFTLSSRHEGLPISMLEAMALGVPPVVTAVGGIPEVITDGIDGVLVHPGHPEELSAAYRRLAADPAQRAALARGAAHRATAFDVATTQRTLESHYERLRRDRWRGRVRHGSDATPRPEP